MIPSGYWKIVAVPDGTNIKADAFVLDQETPRTANFCAGQTTVEAVATRSGDQFFQDFHGTVEPLGAFLGC